MHLNVGLGLPTGSIDETDGQPVRLPYPMQLGSGSYDLHLGSTFNRSIRGSTLGGQLSTVLRLGKNKHGYALGNTYAVQGWYAYFLSDSLSVSLRSKLAGWGDIRGRDSDLNPAMVPSAETDRAGSQLDLGLGVAYSFVTGQFKGSRLGLELTGPVYQRFDSVQLASNWGVTLGWQYAR